MESSVANMDIRMLAKENRVALWEVGEWLGLSESKLTRMMRHEMDSATKERIKSAIEGICRGEPPTYEYRAKFRGQGISYDDEVQDLMRWFTREQLITILRDAKAKVYLTRILDDVRNGEQEDGDQMD